jgi:hypothetical protein
LHNFFTHIIPCFLDKAIPKNKIIPLQLRPQTYDDKLSSIDELFYRSQTYNTCEEYINTMKFIVKLKNLAPFNAWLLYQQNPDVTYVATANHWAKQFNRSIKPKSRAFVIMKAFGPVDFVYDIKDTLGDEELPRDLQAPFRADGLISDEVLQSVINCCLKKDIDIQYNNTIPNRLAGWASHDKLNKYSQIVLNSSHTSSVQFSTLCHELAHLMLGHCGKFINCECENRTHLRTSTKEIEAETVSWLICKRLDIETDADRYLNIHIKNKDALSKISIHKVLTTSDRIENMIVNNACKKEKVK